MPRTRGNVTVADKSVEVEKPLQFEDRINLDADADLDDMEEEVEYEEVEEEVEVEEEEEVEEIEEEVEVEEEEEEDDARKVSDEEEEDEAKKHAELLALPPHGSEVYLGGIPHDASQEELKAFCESIGEVTEVRIMKGKDSGEAKGYAFVTFRTKELATRAIEELNNTEFRGKFIKCSTSQANHRLFIGNVPREWGERDIKNAVKKVGPGVMSIELLKDPQNPSRNRGFVFIEYYNHVCAEYSRKKMANPQFKLDDNAPTVSWADPRNGGSSAASQVKSLYVKNLPKDITQERLRQLFEHHGRVTKVVIPPAKPGHENSRFGFVHFQERSSAMRALKNTETYEIDGHVLDCSLAKPQADQKSTGGSNTQKATPQASYPAPLGYGLVGSPFGALGAGYGPAAFAPPIVYGGGPAPAGMAMMPMLMPDGRIGYVLQQAGGLPALSPPVQPRVGRGSGGSSSGGRHSNDSASLGRSRNRYNPY